MLYILDRILFLNIINKYKYTFTLYYYINYYSKCVTFCKYKMVYLLYNNSITFYELSFYA